nr:MAG TPA: hypothetical protein [Caudoviricetes sp.]
MNLTPPIGCKDRAIQQPTTNLIRRQTKWR